MQETLAIAEPEVAETPPFEGSGRGTAFVHGSVPPLFGIICGWVTHHDELGGSITLGLGDFDGLVLGLLLVGVVLSLLGLLIHPMSRIIDHTLGVSLVVLVVLGMIVLGRICGVSAALTMWAILSISWSNRLLPPFRIGLWQGFGGCTGVIVGSILATI